MKIVSRMVAVMVSIIPVATLISCNSSQNPIETNKTKFINNIEYKIALKAPDAQIKNIILFGIDGLGGEFLKEPHENLFSEIKRNSLYSLEAKSILPSSSSPNWSTIFTGTSNLHHGHFNSVSIKPEFPPIITNEFNRYPTIFYLLKKQKINSKVGLYFGWPNFMNLIEMPIMDKIYNKNISDKSTILEATKYFIKEKPSLLLITQSVDSAGHEYGYGSANYYKEIKKIEMNLNIMINKIKMNKMLDQTLIIITSDHGGYGKSHTYSSCWIERYQKYSHFYTNVPLMFYNPNLKNKGKIKQPLFNWDIAPTIARILGLNFPKISTGQNIEKVEFINNKK